MSRIILASSSPRRRELLTQVGLDFEVIPSTVVEEGNPLPPAQWAEYLAGIKARDVAAQLSGEGFVIGADTIVVLDEVIYGKPLDKHDAYAMLSKLQGRSHRVITGVAIVRLTDGEVRIGHVSTTVNMRPLAAAEIKRYIATGEPMDKAGAYAIQGNGAAFIPEICGCYFNVVGLPIAHVLSVLQELGWSADDV
jgi:septum formation protein